MNIQTKPEDNSSTDSWPGLSTKRFALLLGALLLISFHSVLFGDQAWFYRDYGFLGYPFAFFNREAFWSGEIPFWNSFIHCGVPHFAQWNTMVLYPGSLIYLLLPLPIGLAWFCVLHLFLGGMGMWRLARLDTGSNFAAAFAGVAFVFSGLMLACVIYPNYLVAFAWLPWLYRWARSALKPDWRCLVKAVLAGSMQMLSGAPELILMTWMMIGAVALANAWGAKVEQRGAQLKTAGSFLGLMVVLIAGLCAFQLLPFFDLLLGSQRGTDTGDGFWSLPAWGWINFVAPLFFNFQTAQGVFVQSGQAFFPSIYLGTITVGLALLARGGRRFEIAALWLCAGAALVLALGTSTFVYPLLKSVFPIGLARFPVKGILLLAFILPLLAGHGLATWERCRGCRRMLWVPGLAVGLVIGLGIVLGMNAPLPELRAPATTENAIVRLVLLIVGLLLLGIWQRCSDALRRIAPVGLILIVWIDYQIHTPILNPTISPEAFQPGLAAAYHSQSNPAFTNATGRLMLSPAAEQALHRRMVPKFFDDFVGQRLAYWGNLNMLDGIPKVNGAATLTPERWTLFETDLYQDTEMSHASLMDFAGVDRVTVAGELLKWRIRPTGMPMVTAGQAPAKLSPGSGNWWRGTTWDPKSLVYLETEAGSSNSVSAEISHLQRSKNTITFNVNAVSGTVAIVSESHCSGWSARVDEKSVPVGSANFAFMSIPVPAGESNVVLKYRDPGFFIGVLVSVLTFGGCLLLWRWGKLEGPTGNAHGSETKSLS